MLGKIESRRRRGQQRMRWSASITNAMEMNLGKLGVGDGQGGLACCSPWGHKESDTTVRLNSTPAFEFLASLGEKKTLVSYSLLGATI